jgi:hypothetical protein
MNAVCAHLADTRRAAARAAANKRPLYTVLCKFDARASACGLHRNKPALMGKLSHHLVIAKNLSAYPDMFMFEASAERIFIGHGAYAHFTMFQIDVRHGAMQVTKTQFPAEDFEPCAFTPYSTLLCRDIMRYDGRLIEVNFAGDVVRRLPLQCNGVDARMHNGKLWAMRCLDDFNTMLFTCFDYETLTPIVKFLSEPCVDVWTFNLDNTITMHTIAGKSWMYDLQGAKLQSMDRPMEPYVVCQNSSVVYFDEDSGKLFCDDAELATIPPTVEDRTTVLLPTSSNTLFVLSAVWLADASGNVDLSVFVFE